VRKTLILFCVCLGVAARLLAADNFTLADGSSLSGDIVKFDDHDAMIHTSSDGYTNIAWPQFSQDSLKQLAGSPKYGAYAAPFIAPAAPERSAKEIPVKYEQPVKLPEHPSIFGGMVSSSLGLFILLIVYAANLYAAFEVAVVRGKPIGMVMGVSAVLPIAGPIIFLAQPLKSQSEEEPVGEAAADGSAPGAPPGPDASPEEIQIVSASWQGGQQEEKKAQPQIFSRGKFTLNKRFIETKFAGFIGEPKGDAKNFNMEIKTLKETIAVECIKQAGPAEAILETPNGQLTVPYADIQEVKLIPKPA
jgi:hypothetical protein